MNSGKIVKQNRKTVSQRKYCIDIFVIWYKKLNYG